MNKLHIIMPMAGEGSRFTKEGYLTPKPLLTIDGMFFFMKALSSLENLETHYDEVKYTFIVRQEHIEDFHIDKIIKDMIGYQSNVISVEKTTRGAVETCLLAEPFIEDDENIVIMDCDLYMQSTELNVCGFSGLYDGIVLSFESTLPKYSYAIVGPDGLVIKTAEKNPISTHALAGVYCFHDGATFKKYAKYLIANNSIKNINEYYVSLVYNKMIEDGLLIKLMRTNDYYSFGTPEEYENLTKYD